MELRKFIATTIREYLNENMEYSNNVKFLTSGDLDIEKETLIIQLNIINKYFPFKSVSGKYDSESGVDLYFDNGIQISGKFNNEPFIVNIKINNNEYKFDIYPFNTMGGLDDNLLEKYVEEIYKEENSISLVIGHEGYGIKSITLTKNELNDYKIYLVNGTQIEGKILGVTLSGKKDFSEK